MPRAYSPATRRSRSRSLVHQPTDARTSPRPGRSRTMTSSVGESPHDVGRLFDRHAPRHEGRAHVRDDDFRPGIAQEIATALGATGGLLERPLGKRGDRRSQPRDVCVRRQIGIEASSSRARHEAAVRFVLLLREVARTCHVERVGICDDERAGSLRPAQPLLPGDGVVIEPRDVDCHRTDGLSAVDENRQSRLLSQFSDRQHLARGPEHVRYRDQSRPGRDRRDDRVGAR